MKKVVCFLMIVIGLVSFSSCAILPDEQYSAFIEDLDVITRIQTGLRQMEEGGMTPYVYADMRALEKDLLTLEMADEEVLEINEKFVDAIRLLQRSMQFKGVNEYEARVACEDAGEQIEGALKMLSGLSSESKGTI